MSSIGRIQWLVDFHLHTRNGARRQFSLSQSLWKAPQRRILGGQIEGSQTGWDWCLDFNNLLVRNMQFSLVKPIFRNSIKIFSIQFARRVWFWCFVSLWFHWHFYTKGESELNNRQDENRHNIQPIQNVKSNTLLYHHLLETMSSNGYLWLFQVIMFVIPLKVPL